ncbi:MAG: FAD-dependent oxidoreductase [Candidatus Aminicenantales bacterium]
MIHYGNSSGVRAAGERLSLAVVGGGIAGIASALALADSGKFAVTLFEKDARLGGLCSFYYWQDVVCDRFYHVLLPSDFHTLQFLRQVVPDNRVVWRESRSGFFGENRLVSFSSARDFLRFPFLNLWEKFRLGSGILYSSRLRSSRKFKMETAEQWLSRVFGKGVYENFWAPLLRSKLGEATQSTSASFIWTTIHRLNRARSRASRREHMGYIEGGYASVINAARKKLSDLGVHVRTGTTVEDVKPHGSKIRLATQSDSVMFDRILLAIPAPEIKKILDGTNGRAGWSWLEETEYLGIVSLLLILRRRLSPYYVINLLDRALPFTGVIETTNVIPPESFGGRHLVYLPKYVTTGDPLNAASADRITEDFTKNLKKIFPDLKDEDILHRQVFRERFVQSLPRRLPFKDAPGIRTPLSGVYVASASLVENSTLNNNAVLQVVEEAVRIISADSRG